MNNVDSPSRSRYFALCFCARLVAALPSHFIRTEEFSVARGHNAWSETATANDRAHVAQVTRRSAKADPRSGTKDDEKHSNEREEFKNSDAASLLEAKWFSYPAEDSYNSEEVTEQPDVWADYTSDQCFGPTRNISASGEWSQHDAWRLEKDGYNTIWSTLKRLQEDYVWRKNKDKDGCNLADGSQFFKNDRVASDVLNCWSRQKKKWILFAGDSNTRLLLKAMVNRFEKLEQVSSVTIRRPENGHGSPKWGDWDAFVSWRDAKSQDVTTKLSMRFVSSITGFSVHWNEWEGLWNYDGTAQAPSTPKDLDTLRTPETKPNAIIFSPGLWTLIDRNRMNASRMSPHDVCASAPSMYTQLWHDSACTQNKCLFITTADIGWHTEVPTSNIAISRNCVLESRNRITRLWRLQPPPKIFDLFEMTQALPSKSWVSYGNGFHYSRGTWEVPEPGPVGRIVVAAWLKFLCST